MKVPRNQIDCAVSQSFNPFDQVDTVVPRRESHGLVCKPRAKDDLPNLSEDGDITLGGIFSAHLDVIHDVPSFVVSPSDVYCESFDISSFRLIQTMIFAIEEINRSKTLLPNITLGYEIYDDCSTTAIASKAALALVNGKQELIEYPECKGSSNVAAIIGCDISTSSIAAARTVGSFRIPMISYFSTCSCLSDKLEYPTFFRTIPSDKYQSKLLAELVKTFGWNWIGTVRSNTEYGNFGMRTFVEEAKKNGVCIAYSESFYRTDPAEKISKIVQVMKEATTKVVIGFLHGGDMRVLIKEILRQNVTGIQWIGSEGWVTKDIFSLEEEGKFLVGAIGPATRRTEIVGLRDIFVKKFWETLFSCSLTTGDATETRSSTFKERPCTGNEHLDGLENAYLPEIMDGSSYHVYKAVYAVAHALHDMVSCEEGNGPFVNNTCAHIFSFESWQLLHYLHLVNFTAQTGEVIYFDENGDPDPTYELVNLQMNFEGALEIVNIGYYDGSALEGQELVLNISDIVWSSTGKQIPRALCSEPCPVGTRKVSRKGQPLCCFDCTECADGEVSNTTDSTDCMRCPLEYWSNEQKDECIPKKIEFLSFQEALGCFLVGLALVGVCLAVAAATVFFRYRETPIVRANNSELSFLLLFALTLCFLCTLTFIGKPTRWSCMFRRTVFGIVFVLCISCILGKTILVVIAFKATLPNNNLMNWFGPKQQRLGVFGLTFLQVLICTIWLIVSPPYPVKNMTYYKDIIILECDVGSLKAFYFVSSYIGLLSTVCFLLAFLARKLPDNFNDAKYITFSMLIFCAVWITFIPAYVSSPGMYTVAVEVFAIWASSFGLLVCIFAPKCYIILLKPENNTKKNMMGKESSL
ncbi:extracellular calcium-sensing receptor-like [Stegostoma tigrinum]|uniref:extracellular calcium-sensing receptor-like n=1 Tax=Stegostoma tigrinum TaxID=3053191 RepID=UPI0028701817|nr:extracellular calcium-sensing receptor-like [Stegostoma tigrinum]